MKLRTILAWLPLLMIGFFAFINEPITVKAAVTYDREAAVNWARANNRNDNNFYGSSQGRWCTNYIARALNAGGLNVPTNWIGNQQIISWMLNNPNSWEFRSLDQLIAGDIVLYSDQPEAPSDWAHTFSNGASRWSHSALVIAPGRVAAWNAEYWDISIGYVAKMPYRVGIHIKDEETTQPVAYQHQGSLSYGATQVRNLNSEQRWHIHVQSNHAPLLFDLRRHSGDGSYRVVLKNAAGASLVTTRASVNGRAIVSYPTPANEDLYVHVIPDDGVTIDYEVTAWANSIPRIAYEWEYQDAYYDRNTSRWQAYVGDSSSNFYVNFERYAGDLEFQWRLQTRSGTVLSSGSSSDGRVIAPGKASGWVDFYITSTSGSGSYRISLRQGAPNPGIPHILTPGIGTVVDNNFTVNIEPGPGNGRGTPDWHVQIDNNADFSSPEFDNDTGWSLSPEIPVQLIQPGEYFIRVRQGDHIDRASNFTDPMPFTVESVAEFGVKAIIPTTTYQIGDNLQINFALEYPDLAPGDGVFALDANCTISPVDILTGQSMNTGNVFSDDAVEISLGFQSDNSFIYAISQRGTDPAITSGGVFLSLSLLAVAEGQATLDCTTNVIDGNKTMVEVPFASVTIAVEAPAPQYGIVSGIVQREVAVDDGILVELVQDNTVVYSATTQADGTFIASDVTPGTYEIRATSIAYLSAVGAVDVIAGQTSTMPGITLLAGEVVSSDTSAGVIDLLDASTLGAHYLSAVPPAPESADSDRNAVVDLQDLYRLSSNWGQVTSVWN